MKQEGQPGTHFKGTVNVMDREPTTLSRVFGLQHARISSFPPATGSRARCAVGPSRGGSGGQGRQQERSQRPDKTVATIWEMRQNTTGMNSGERAVSDCKLHFQCLLSFSLPRQAGMTSSVPVRGNKPQPSPIKWKHLKTKRPTEQGKNTPGTGPPR